MAEVLKPPGAGSTPERVAPGGADQTALATRVSAGDRAAEDELVARYRDGLVMVLRRWTGDHALAEDLSQDVLLIVIERLRERVLDDPAKLGAFMRGIAHNLVLAHDRLQTRRRTMLAGDLIDLYADAEASPLTAAARAEEARLVHRLIDELGTARDREILRRYYIIGEAKEQICGALGLDAVHFNRVLHRARQRLGALLAGSGLGDMR